jgi:two-component system, OmpR family, response regulator
MIVDDDKLTVTLLTTLLELDDFEVTSVPDGANAYVQAGNVMPAAFLVDYHLADGAGTEFVRKLRADSRFATTPVVMASGLDRSEEATEAGANHFLIKPFDPDDLVQLLKKLLA